MNATTHTIEVSITNVLEQHLTVVTCPETQKSHLVVTDTYGMGACPCGERL